MSKDVRAAEFRLTVIWSTDEKTGTSEAHVKIEPLAEYPFHLWMLACEFMLHRTAQMSAAGYERAMELLFEGAKTFRITPPNPKKKKKKPKKDKDGAE